MGTAAKRHRAVVFLTLVAVGLSLGLPAEDVLEAVYDESEALPYDATTLFSILSQPVAARAPEPMLKAGCLAKCCERRTEPKASSVLPIHDSLTILDHLFRC